VQRVGDLDIHALPLQRLIVSGAQLIVKAQRNMGPEAAKRMLSAFVPPEAGEERQLEHKKYLIASTDKYLGPLGIVNPGGSGRCDPQLAHWRARGWEHKGAA
jgi:hypothetical protein